MCNTLRVRWTLTPKIAPQPWINCSGCAAPKAFQPTGKVRLNANGRRLDAWLIYTCTDCAKTWNRPIFERRAVREIGPAVLEALQSNDPDWIRTQMFNVEALRQKSMRIDEFAELDVEKALLREDPDWVELVIELRVLLPVSMRLDRLLASELGISRSRLQALEDAGRLRTSADLRKRVRTGAIVALSVDESANWRAVAVCQRAIAYTAFRREPPRMPMSSSTG